MYMKKHMSIKQIPKKYIQYNPIQILNKIRNTKIELAYVLLLHWMLCDGSMKQLLTVISYKFKDLKLI